MWGRSHDYDYGYSRYRRWRMLRWVAACLALVLALAAVTGFVLYRHLDRNLQALDPDLGPNRPERILVPGPRQPLNILLVGAETLPGEESGTGLDVDESSQSTILLHVSANRRHGYGISIPSDLVVSRPACPTGSGAQAAAVRAAPFKSAFEIGRIGCSVRTVEAMTKIRIDHFLITSFEGLRNSADALGGVPIRMTRAVHDTKLGVTLPAGSYDVSGDQALSYVTMTTGASGEIGRIRRQQAFLAAMTDKALSSGTLTNPVKLYRFLDATTKAVAVDKGLASLGALRSLAGELKAIGIDRVEFLTMPIAPYGLDGRRFAPSPDARGFWDRLRHDQELSATDLLGSTSGGNASP
jgi:LCP family protein required for cell wall assembly